MSLKAVIVCGGAINGYENLKKHFENAGLVICADSGAHHLRNFGVEPDLMLGDFDSISKDDYLFFEKNGVEITRYPVEKDMTDAELAVNTAIGKGCRNIIMLGATGTRLDHTLANILLLKRMISAGVKGIIADDYNEIHLIDKFIELEREDGFKVSLLPVFGKVAGVTTKGLFYPLKGAALEQAATLGISNEFIDDIASISIESGLLLVIKSRD